MTAQEIRVEIERITAAVKRHEWTPEVFERTEAILYYQGGDIFNTLRRELLTVHFVTISVRISQSWRTGSAEKGRRKHGNRRKQRS